MSLLAHILDRFVIHFFASTSLVLLAFYGIRWGLKKLMQKFDPQWITSFFPLILAGLLVFAFSTLREAVDVSNGQPLVKAFTDYLSWLLGCGASAYLIYRLLRQR